MFLKGYAFSFSMLLFEYIEARNYSFRNQGLSNSIQGTKQKTLN